MPITAKLARTFCDQLGDQAANELVDWMNDVDLSYRQEFKDLFDANFGRLEAELGRVEARLRAELTLEISRVERSLIRWMFGFWIGSWATILGSLLVLRQLGILTH